jgi:hypothetical protein
MWPCMPHEHGTRLINHADKGDEREAGWCQGLTPLSVWQPMPVHMLGACKKTLACACACICLPGSSMRLSCVHKEEAPGL